ncbi:hypothetical protein Ancab_000068 [Ancistrocladus abbreviatus]
MPSMASAPPPNLLCFFFFTLMFLLPFTFRAFASGNILALGASLSATTNTTESSWLSPSGDFAFGFYPLDDNDAGTNTSGRLFLLSIWYVKIPKRTIAWYAGEDGVLAPELSKLVLTADKGIVLSDPHGTEVWSSSTSISAGNVSRGFLNDTGNFALTDGNNQVVWQSFDEPRDTILPTQTVGILTEINSRFSKTNFSRGRFQMRLIPDGNLVLNTRSLVTDLAYDAYWMTGTNDPNSSENSGYKLIYNETGHMYVLRRNGAIFDLMEKNVVVSTKDYYHRATLNFDGVFAWYYHPRTATGENSSGWVSFKVVPDNICTRINGEMDSGACGYNNICQIGDDQRPICGCPPGFSLLDPKNKYGSCRPNFKQQNCEDDEGEKDGYRIQEMPNTDWPNSDYDKLDNFSPEDCKNSCMNDCFCDLAILRDGTCWKKKLPLANGRMDVSVTSRAFIKVKDSVDGAPTPTDPLAPNPDPGNNRNKLNIVVSVLLGGSVFVNIILIVIVGFCIFFFYNRQFNQGQGGKPRGGYNICSFSYKELEEATSGFKEELGRGAFGVVYKGVMGSTPGDQQLVAVKKLKSGLLNEAEREFKTVVQVIGQTHHKNLVQLIGFCEEKEHRLLVYEFMSNGSLADFLFSDFKLSWMERIRIAQGIARGLLYLHEECSTQIIHCDIKPQNILLDEYHNARISDFGLAKLLMLNQSQTHTAIRGTKGYVAPEWFKNKPVTVKVDVYSYGVLLLEIVCCRRSLSPEMIRGEENGAVLTDWALDCYQAGKLDALVPNDMEVLDDWQRFEKFVMVAIWCIQEDAAMRPTIKKVTQMLEGVIQVPCPPCSSMSSITIST